MTARGKPEVTVLDPRLFRALLAVAKAAQSCRADRDWINMVEEVDEYAALDRALDRLDRASKAAKP